MCIHVVCVPVCVVYVCVCVLSCVCVCVCMCMWPHVYSGVCYASVQCMCTFRRPTAGDTICVGNTMHVQRTNPMGHDVHVYRGPILWDSACKLHIHVPTCMYSISSEGSMSCTKRELNMQTCSG